MLTRRVRLTVTNAILTLRAYFLSRTSVLAPSAGSSPRPSVRGWEEGESRTAGT